jgi:hypothetical protein
MQLGLQGIARLGCRMERLLRITDSWVVLPTAGVRSRISSRASNRRKDCAKAVMALPKCDVRRNTDTLELRRDFMNVFMRSLKKIA